MMVLIFLFIPAFNIGCTAMGVEMYRADVICTAMLALECRQTVRMWTSEVPQ